jgi:hypothetical protein
MISGPTELARTSHGALALLMVDGDNRIEVGWGEGACGVSVRVRSLAVPGMVGGRVGALRAQRKL